MAERTNKRKVAKAATAVGMAAVLLMGGTFAWQSISQEATNIVTATVNPGGRLHDDFDGSNDKNIYVENFGTQNIYARIKLSEYLEIGQDAGNFAEDSNRENNLANGDIEVLLGEEIDTKATYTTYKYGETNTSDEYWTKDWDGSTKYIPTFNKDQDSLEADLNGTYEYTNDAGENVPYGDFVDYNTAAADYSETDIEWYDADTNDSAEAHVNPDSVTAGSHEIKEDQTHALADSIDGTVISMADWDGTSGAYWVYDSDGWAYWAQAIEPGTATGLLLDSITDLGLIDEDYYYAIHVTGQFITAGDLGQDDNTGFYADGEVPTDEALTLLDAIGVKVDGSEEDTEKEYIYDAVIADVTSEDTSVALSDVKYGSTVQLGVYDANGAALPVSGWSVFPGYDDELIVDTAITEGGELTIGTSENIAFITVEACLAEGENAGKYVQTALWIEYPSIRVNSSGATYLAPSSSETFTLGNLYWYSTNEDFNNTNYTNEDVNWSVFTDPASAENYSWEVNNDGDNNSVVLTHTCASADVCDCAATVFVQATLKENPEIYGMFWVRLYKNSDEGKVDTMHVYINDTLYKNNEGGEAHNVTVEVDANNPYIHYSLGEAGLDAIAWTFTANEGSDMGSTYSDGTIHLDSETKPTSFTMVGTYREEVMGSRYTADTTIRFNVTVNYVSY